MSVIFLGRLEVCDGSLLRNGGNVHWFDGSHSESSALWIFTMLNQDNDDISIVLVFSGFICMVMLLDLCVDGVVKLLNWEIHQCIFIWLRFSLSSIADKITLCFVGTHIHMKLLKVLMHSLNSDSLDGEGIRDVRHTLKCINNHLNGLNETIHHLN